MLPSCRQGVDGFHSPFSTMCCRNLGLGDSGLFLAAAAGGVGFGEGAGPPSQEVHPREVHLPNSFREKGLK